MTPEAIVGVVIGAVISSAVVAALITGLFNLIINRRNARIQESRNASEEGQTLVDRYKEQAAEERAAKESAVRTVKELLSIAEGQIASLKDTIERLTATIKVLTDAANVQQDIIDSVTAERDHLKLTLETAQKAVDKQREEIISRQARILNMQEPDLEGAS